VSDDIARSWLLISARAIDHFEPAWQSDADRIILDIEDAVDPTFKDAARADVATWLGSGVRRAWVRINDRTSRFWSDDVDQLAGLPGLQGVMLAKSESAADVTETYDRLGGATPVIPLVESAVGIEEAVSIAKARGALRLAFGSGDYRRDTGASVDDLAMAYPRSRLVVASRIGNLPGPIDGPTVGTNHRLLREQSEHAVALGLTGKLCLDRGQLSVVNEAISPTRADIEWARGFLVDFEARGRMVRDGSDLPRLGRAEKLLRLSAAFEITATDASGEWTQASRTTSTAR
jgi:citrate lyase subunit beta/citryl-CoA lyase